MALQALYVAAAGLGISMSLGFLILPLLRRRALDVPNARSSHAVPTPRGGGIAVVLAIILPTAVARPELQVFLVCSSFSAVAVLGLIDDLRGLGEATRFGIQLFVSVVTAALLLQDRVGLPVVGLLLVIGAAAFWLAAFVNAFNFMDGINGISAISAAIAASWYLWLGRSLELDRVVVLAAALLGAAIGFLPLNFPDARVFLGDVGSYGLGMVLGSLALMALAGGAPVLQSAAPLMVYVADTGWTLLRRMIRRERWWTAHRENVYQRLTEAGVSRVLVAVAVPGLSVLLCTATLTATAPAIKIAMVTVVLVLYLSSPQLRLARH